METWFMILVSLCLCALLQSLFTRLKPTNRHSLPPGPTAIPILSSLSWLLKSFSELEPILRSLRAKYGPFLQIAPPAFAISRVISSNQHNISSAFYGPTWRLLRRNLTSEILHPSRVKSYSHARRWVLDILINSLKPRSTSNQRVRVRDHIQYAMFCLLVLMCFGDKLEENKIKQVEEIQRILLLSFGRFNLLNFWPSLTRILFRKRWEEFFQLRRRHESVLVPLIRARKKEKQESLSKDKEEFVVSYVDTLLDLELPDEKRKLEEGEIVSLCSEFLDAGTDTTSTALQWIMANLVKYPRIQEKLFEEIQGVVDAGQEEIREDDLHKMPYLKAVVLEGLRRHPPGHFVLPHAVTQDTILDGFRVPKNGSVNFMVAEMGWDAKVWEDPMMFKPERFMNSDNSIDVEAFDITGTNLIWDFKWVAVDGDSVDLSEKQEFTVVMKNPLEAHVSRRERARVVSYEFRDSFRQLKLKIGELSSGVYQDLKDASLSLFRQKRQKKRKGNSSIQSTATIDLWLVQIPRKNKP
ncbi:hypothetical protein OIU76_008311 [Salix suchowensis]|nr:hypothetical protein OIU76_008311 [Salix suchowensis]